MGHILGHDEETVRFPRFGIGKLQVTEVAQADMDPSHGSGTRLRQRDEDHLRSAGGGRTGLMILGSQTCTRGGRTFHPSAQLYHLRRRQQGSEFGADRVVPTADGSGRCRIPGRKMKFAAGRTREDELPIR
jgi:hypothetical protein